MLITLMFRRLSQNDHVFEATLAYIVRFILKVANKNKLKRSAYYIDKCHGQIN